MWASIDSAPYDGSTITAREAGGDSWPCHWNAIAGHPTGGAWVTHGRGLLRPFRPVEWLFPSVISVLSLPAIPDPTPVVLLADGYAPVERTAMVQSALGVAT